MFQSLFYKQRTRMKHVSYYPTPNSTTSKRRRVSVFSAGSFKLGYGKAYAEAPPLKIGAEWSDVSGRTSITGGGSTKSAGFISTKLRARRPRADKFNIYGVTEVLEVGGIINGGVASATAGNTIAVGHASVPPNKMHQMMWRAIVKKLFVRAGVADLSNFASTIPGGASGGTFFIIVSYQNNADSNIITHTINVLPGVSTYEALANELELHFRSNYSPDFIFSRIELQYNGVGAIALNPTFLNLKSCMVHMTAKSSLKVQNQTVETTGDEDSVNNVPLHGKAYYGKGNGTEAFTRDPVVGASGVTFRADNFNGAIARVPTERWYQEVVPASHFNGVKSFGKVVLEPGHIKTSVLKFYQTIPLNIIYRKLFGANAIYTHPKSFLGEYRFMLLEKMIQATNPSEGNAIKVSYETNLRVGCFVTMRNDTTTAQLNKLMDISSVM